MAVSQPNSEGRETTASTGRIRLLDTFIVLLCITIVVLVVLTVTGHGSRHEGGPIAAMAGSLAAVSASRNQLARGAPPLDPAMRARRKRLVAIALLVAVVSALAGAAAVLVFHSGQ